MSAKLLSRFAQMIAVAAIATGAHAVPFKITGGTATTTGVSLGSKVAVTPSSDVAQTFDLEVGETSDVFNFLDVKVSGAGAVVGYVDASLIFSDPIATSADGVLGGFAVLLGFASGGLLTVLSDPGPIAFGDTGLFDVNFFGFSDACMDCKSLSGTVTYTVKLLSAPTTSVPEPATLSLLGAGLLAIGLARRRKRAAA